MAKKLKIEAPLSRMESVSEASILADSVCSHANSFIAIRVAATTTDEALAKRTQKE